MPDDGGRGERVRKAAVSPAQAIGLAILGYTLWVMADANLKVAGASRLRAYEVIGLLGMTEAALVLGYSLIRGQVRSLWPKRPVWQVLRSLLDLGNNICLVIALRHLPLALFYILVFLAPMVTAVLAAVLLGETLDWRRGLAIAAGFMGVVVAVNPMGMTRPGSWIGYLACMACVACFSGNMVWSRRLTQSETSLSLIFVSGLVTGVPGCVGLVLRPQAVSLHVALVLMVTALFCVVGSGCFFLALKNTSAATVSQYHYSQLLTGALIAYLFWHEKPTAAMFAGAVLIVAAGVYTAARSHRGAAEMEAFNLTVARE